jgi:ribonuclease HII
VLAKVTRDRIMVGLDREHPAYDFKTHKGYITDVHATALTAHGPCPQHRMRFVNVRRAAGLEVDPSDPSVEEAVPLDPLDRSLEGADPAGRVPSVGELVVGTRVEARPTRGESA